MRNPHHIVITGASSGIGEALARTYACRGIRLSLTGRDPGRLETVATACRDRGAKVTGKAIDVRHRSAMAAWLGEIDADQPVDLVIANAGISAGTGSGTETEDQTRAILSANLDGVLNTVLPLIPAMTRRRRGQIGLMSSLAGYRGFPGAPAYCASKAAVKVWGESLRGELADHGIAVSVICPGYVRSRMTAVNKFPMPFLINGDHAARIIAQGLERNRARIAFPWQMALAAWLVTTLPPAWTDAVMRRLPRKG